MFKTTVKLMRLSSEELDTTDLVIMARDVYEDLEPSKPDDRFTEMPLDDWIAAVTNNLGWDYGNQFLVCTDGQMLVRPDYAHEMVDVAPSFLGDAFKEHLNVIRDAVHAGYYLAYHEMKSQAALPPDEEDQLFFDY